MAGAKYGDSTRKYGDVTRLYGQDGTNPGGSVQWMFLVDWDNDGSFNYNEASYMVDMETNRGQRYLVQPGGNGFETIQPGDGSITLENIGRRFDPDFVGGPLENKILPGRKFRLMVKDLTTGTVYDVMAGIIYDIPPITEVDRIVFSLRESLFLLDRRITLDTIYRQNIKSAMYQLLVAASWPSYFGMNLDDESQYITLFAADNINALDTIINLGDACLGQLFTDASGKVIFYSRGHSTMDSIAIGQADCLKAIRRSQPWENLRNIVQVMANKKVKAPECAIWQNSGPITLAASSTVTFTVTYGAALSPRVWSISANSLANGTGFNRISSVTYTTTYYLGRITFIFTNAYAAIVYITELVVLGKPVIDQPMMLSATNGASRAIYGDMVFNMDNPWLQSYNHAKYFANQLSDYLDAPQRTIEITIEQRPDLQYSFDLMDKIPFTAAKLFAATQDMFVGRIEHRWNNKTGQAVTTTLVLRPRWTDATAVANDTENPDLPIIPDPPIPPGGWPPPPPPPPPPGGECLTNPDAPANGPFAVNLGFIDSLPFELRSDGDYHKVFDVNWYNNVWIRPGYFTNKTYLAIEGDWGEWHGETGQWIGDTSATNWRASINGLTGTLLGPVTDGGSGTRLIQFTPGIAQRFSSLVCEVDPTDDTPTGELDITPVEAFSGGHGGAGFTGNDIFYSSWHIYTEGEVPATSAGVWTVNIPVQLTGVTDWRGTIKLVSATSAAIQWFSFGSPIAINAGYIPVLIGSSYSNACVFTAPGDVGTSQITSPVGDTGGAYGTVPAGRYYFCVQTREGVAVSTLNSCQLTDIEYQDGSGWHSLKDLSPVYDPVHRWVIRGMALYNVCTK